MVSWHQPAQQFVACVSRLFVVLGCWFVSSFLSLCACSCMHVFVHWFFLRSCLSCTNQGWSGCAYEEGGKDPRLCKPTLGAAWPSTLGCLTQRDSKSSVLRHGTSSRLRMQILNFDQFSLVPSRLDMRATCLERYQDCASHS